MSIVRPAHRGDLTQLGAICDYYVENSIASFDTELTSSESRAAWFEAFSCQGPYRLLVASDGRAGSGVRLERPIPRTSRFRSHG